MSTITADVAPAHNQDPNGYSAFDAHLIPDVELAARNGEIFSVGYINGNGGYTRLGCFEYCNDLAGTSSCTGGTRTCPQAMPLAR